MAKPLKVVVSVINDLSTDQRVARMCASLHQQGYVITLIGRLLPESISLTDRPYKTIRFKLPVTKGVLFYVLFNIRLFFFLLKNKFDVYHANDLDTLLPNKLISTFYNKPLVYDAHEYFTGVPELVNNNLKRAIWKLVEKICFKKLRFFISANSGIGGLYEKEYGIKPVIVRNIPPFLQVHADSVSRESLGLPKDTPVLILQGAGININRGAEELIEAMALLPDVVLLLIGGGDVMDSLPELALKKGISNRVIFKPKMSYSQLMQYTRLATIGITLDKPDNLNYSNSLPNKLFDYIAAEIPVFTSNIQQVAELVTLKNIGLVAQKHDPEHLAECLTLMLNNKELYLTWKKNVKTIAPQFSWESEVKPVINMYGQFN